MLLITLDWLALRLEPLRSSLAEVFGCKNRGKARFGWELSISYGKVVRWRRKGKKNKSHERRPRLSQMWQPSWKLMNWTHIADLKLETPWAGEVRIGPQWLYYGSWHKYLTLLWEEVGVHSSTSNEMPTKNGTFQRFPSFLMVIYRNYSYFASHTGMEQSLYMPGYNAAPPQYRWKFLFAFPLHFVSE